jgi:hypothetical protein
VTLRELSALVSAMQTPPSLPLKKPKTFMLVGIALLVLGAFYLLGILANVAMGSIPAMREQNPVFKLLEQNPDYAVVHYGTMALNVVLGIVAILGGIGLLKSKNWGRLLGIAWAAITILGAPLGFWVSKKYMEPAMMSQLQQANASGVPPELMTKLTTVFAIAGGVFWIAVCIVVIIFLARPKMKAWCRLQDAQGPGVS